VHAHERVARIAVRDLYTFGKELGQGNFGVVFEAMDKMTGARYACKSISKKNLTSLGDVEDVRRELQVVVV
jgi:calcium-dependent protein kinase